MLKPTSVKTSQVYIYNACFNFLTLVYGLNINYNVFEKVAIVLDDKTNKALYNILHYYLEEQTDYLITFVNNNSHFFYNALFRLIALFNLSIALMFSTPNYISEILYGKGEKVHSRIKLVLKETLRQKIDRGFFKEGNAIFINEFSRKLSALSKDHSNSIQSYTIPQIVKTNNKLVVYNKI